ncbi:response regulator transcription factor [Sporanaerobacter acetigenes]|uniref:DNA-binding response regulator, OmpR family, contains REC and winged-helix (WHTH) domain n=1 Tax=Sporanaerobacter acetigenes DSM 13106 TaxID=1123281 RepID=A0A1M5SC70_9FIRM|nr:response regulator transcription factor [Sporanaerobacter acetigenes]SHH36065.1 DNA-binding response regulator, OmpR family, contains REC and winged-helix (wHTH) domain [Sporanaerobacter acetigenes DSM 13106]
MYKIMVIEDDDKISSLIKNKLEKYGYIVTIVEDYSDIKGEFIKEDPHLVLLDINLPYYDGFFWCREIRSISKVPIIFISARFSDMDQVMAIENGGDDYITKPFSFDILLAKVKGAIRRAYGEYAKGNSMDVYEVEGVFLYKSQNIVEYKEKRVELSKKEFALLYILASNLESIVERDTLLGELWDDMDFVDDNTLSVNIGRLRRRLEDIGIFEAIKTKREQGYSMTNTWS